MTYHDLDLSGVRSALQSDESGDLGRELDNYPHRAGDRGRRLSDAVEAIMPESWDFNSDRIPPIEAPWGSSLEDGWSSRICGIQLSNHDANKLFLGVVFRTSKYLAARHNFSSTLRAYNGHVTGVINRQRWSPLDARGYTKRLLIKGFSSIFLRTPNGIRTRAATLKGWERLVEHGNKVADQGTFRIDNLLPTSCSGRSTGTIDLKLRGWPVAPSPINPSNSSR